MAASVRIEDEAFSDVRYVVLALELGLPDADCARGKMSAVWRQCTAQQTHVLSEPILIAILGPKGPAAMVIATLAEAVEGGFRIRGTRGRIEWLGKLRKAARKGGAARAASRLPKRVAKRRTQGVVEEHSTQPSSSPPALTPSPVTSPSPAQSQPVADATARKRTIVDWFHDLYLSRYGTKPVIGKGDAASLTDLAKKLDEDELQRRCLLLFDGKGPSHLKPPYDIKTLVGNINRLSVPSGQGQLAIGRVEPKAPGDYPEGDVPL